MAGGLVAEGSTQRVWKAINDATDVVRKEAITRKNDEPEGACHFEPTFGISSPSDSDTAAGQSAGDGSLASVAKVADNPVIKNVASCAIGASQRIIKRVAGCNVISIPVGI